ncbi:hypothetical protein VNO78_30673 [Psophocarpus tetragonolobus]|uniref:Lachrymatory factor synthase n=1 Tax=Psophocarpus tetragonolobus TaxID=3891 RepID=A0AAN9RYD2_PSOTE
MEPESQQRWEGKVSAKLKTATKEQAWPLVKDFFNLHKRFPSLATCHGVHGSNGEPGCIRFCAGSSIPSSSNGADTVSWSNERLVAVDDLDLTLKYQMVENNLGFRSYESTIRVLDDGEGCMLEWCFKVEPVVGLVLEELVGKYRVGLQAMAHKMEEEIESLAMLDYKCEEIMWQGEDGSRLWSNWGRFSYGVCDCQRLMFEIIAFITKRYIKKYFAGGCGWVGWTAAAAGGAMVRWGGVLRRSLEWESIELAM